MLIQLGVNIVFADPAAGLASAGEKREVEVRRADLDYI